MSNIDFIVQSHFIAGQPANSPIVLWSFGDGDFDILQRNSKLLVNTFHQQPKQMLFRLYGSTVEHADFDDGVAFCSSRWKIEIARVQRKETMGTLVFRILERFDHSGVNHIR